MVLPWPGRREEAGGAGEAEAGEDTEDAGEGEKG